MRIAIQSQHHHDHEEFHLPHQGLWFFVMLIVLLLLLSKPVGSAIGHRPSSIVDRRSSIVSMDDGRSTMDDVSASLRTAAR